MFFYASQLILALIYSITKQSSTVDFLLAIEVLSSSGRCCFSLVRFLLPSRRLFACLS